MSENSERTILRTGEARSAECRAREREHCEQCKCAEIALVLPQKKNEATKRER